MPGPLKLAPSLRPFLGLVAEALAANPFTAEREELDRRIAGSTGEEAGSPGFAAVVAARLAELESAGRLDVSRYAGADADLLRRAVLFDAYYGLRDELDLLIDRQVAQGDEPCDVPFAGEALALLERRGLSGAEAEQRFATFFQTRRAYYFIDRSLIGTSPSMRELRRALWDNVFTRDIGWYADYLWDRMEDFSTLLLGETGTGKGSAARAIGCSGFIPFDRRRGRFVESFTRAFVSLNLSQYAEPLIESELFGHRKGAFTGAVESHEGVLARCSPHGSIFLDEIGELAAPVQIKLLQVLQERTFTPVGGRGERRFEGRVIAATNRSLAGLRAPGGFRDDFYYRLCSDVVELPTLRRRLEEEPGELEQLVRLAVGRIMGRDVPELADGIRAELARGVGAGYPWPGNVRELEQGVRRILLRGTYAGDVTAPAVREAGPAELLSGEPDARELLARYCALLHARHGSYAEVARRTRLDRRTVKRHLEEARGYAREARTASSHP